MRINDYFIDATYTFFIYFRFLDLEEHNLFASIFTDSHYTRKQLFCFSLIFLI